jgi:hypothetical protein
MICSSPRIEFRINLQGIMMASRKIRSTYSLKDIIKALIANHMGSCPLDQQRVFFLLLLHEYLREGLRILRVYKILRLIFLTLHSNHLNNNFSEYYRILYCTFIGMQIQLQFLDPHNYTMRNIIM